MKIHVNVLVAKELY